MISFFIRIKIKKHNLFLLSLASTIGIALYVYSYQTNPKDTHEIIVPSLNHEKGDTLLVLISDYRSYSPTQVIQIVGFSIKYGFATVVYPFDHLSGRDIIWEPDFKMDKMTYPIITRELSITERKEIGNVINELNNANFVDSRSFTDDYQYIIYYKGQKIASAYTRSFESGALSSTFQQTLTKLLSLVSPLYPNYGPHMIE